MPRLVRSSIGRWVDPAVVFTTLFGDQTDVVWLDSGPAATSGKSYLGRGSRVAITETHASLLEFLRTELAANRVEDESDGFALGWVGWVGYETRFETMGVPRTQTSQYPDTAFLYLDRAIEFDHGTREVSLLSLGDDDEWRESVVESLRGGSFAGSRSGVNSFPELVDERLRAIWRDTDDEYLAKIRACQAAIAAGNAYLLCLTTEVRVDAAPDPVATYLALRASSPSHHGALLRVGELALLSSSPEQFLTVTPAGLIESRPIKGTRPRGSTDEADVILAAELAASEKERAENLMIVDLMRNDIGRVSRIGSVEVPSLLAVETYAHVHQLVSTVRGQLAEGLDPMDVVVACFPAGSMTGTPKSSATRILESLEGAPRGIYSGAFGYFGLDGRIDLAMVIRSIVISPKGATIGSGGGITALSDPHEELAEVKLKAAALLGVLGAT
ncbi:MAG TPA: anthranilate synthase component I family protein [Galbitalea sp.]|nr:anthranilate synthase component I family protein [Galbitalea sp.]